MRASEQWERIERDLPQGWIEARLSFTVEDPKAVPSAAGVLAPLGPGRAGSQLRFSAERSGVRGVESVANLMERLDRKRIWGTLTLLDARAPTAGAPEAPEAARAEDRDALADAWDAALAKLPPDWSDLLCELELDSSDYVPRAALHGAPLNPSRVRDRIALRFRVSRRGYGASPGMARRCFERMDDERITGAVTVLEALSEVDYAATQGPVFRVGGRSV